MSRKLRNSASLTALAIAAGLTMSSPAIAGDLGGPPAYKPAAMPAQTSWHGLYFGGHIGAGEANLEGIAFDTDSVVLPDLVDLSGILGGLHIGYNWDRGGKWVFGLEADISGMDWTDRQPSVDSSNEMDAEADMLASIRARLGVAIGNQRQGLLYATAGIAFPDVTANVFGSTRDNSDSVVRADFDEIGGVVGTGFVFAITDNFRIGAEGLYYWFDDNDSLFGQLTSAFAGDNVGLDDAYAVRLRGTWYFNGRS